MTVTAEDIGIYTPFSVGAGEDDEITDAAFNSYKALTQHKLDREDPGMEAEEYDHAHALLIAHTYVASQGDLEKTREKIDDYWYDKPAGVSSYLLQYNQLIAEVQESTRIKATGGVTHSDAGMEQMKLDQHDVPALYDPEAVDAEVE